jgi:hypothetical protein
MKVYVVQINRDGKVTVFDSSEEWVGVFRNYEHAARFVRLVLGGTLSDDE